MGTHYLICGEYEFYIRMSINDVGVGQTGILNESGYIQDSFQIIELFGLVPMYGHNSRNQVT